MSTANQFTGSIPATYDRCLGPVLFEPYAADLVRRLPPPGDRLRALELACGTGILTRRLRQALPPSATLLATDLNDAMVTYARTAVAEPNIEWRTADAQALPFADASFDVVLCQFGLMFLPDKPRGFREASRVLAPGGVFLGNVWQAMAENPLSRAMQTRLDRLFPDDPPRFFETPYGYHDPVRLRADLAASGWQTVHLDDVALHSASSSASHLATGFVRGSPLSHELLNRGANLDQMVDELTDALIPVGGESPFTAELAATVITATR